MDSGYSFILNQKSDYTKGQVQFFYKRIKADKGALYPVYLTFNGDSINFYFNGCVKTEEIEEYVETKLFSLHLHNDETTHHRLTNDLRELYDGIFPLLDNSELLSKPEERNKLCNAYHHVFIKEKKKKENNLKRKQKNKLQYYSLILDFLFDVKHTNVFDNAPSFDKIKHLLKNATILQAIARKAEYYYQVKIYSNESIHNFNNNLYTEDLINAQSHWLEIIQKEGNDKIIKAKNNWFKDVETETYNVFSVNSIFKDENTEKYKEKYKESKKISSRWFLARSNIADAWNLMFNIKESFVVPSILISSYFFLLIALKVNLFKLFSIYVAIIVALVLFLALFVKRMQELVLPRLIFLIMGATYLAFEISRYFNSSYIKNTWTYLSFHFSLNWNSINGYLLTFASIILFFSYKILRNSEEKNHPNLETKTYRGKVGVLILVVLVISFITNTLLLNTFHFRKELFEENLLVNKIWTDAFDKENQHHKETHTKQNNCKEEKLTHDYHDKLVFKLSNTINCDTKDELFALVTKMENPMYNQEREHLFNENLKYIYVYDIHDEGGETKLYPLVKEYNILGFSVKIVPPVLFINILVTLFLVVFMQIIIHHKKVVDGGHFE